MVKLHKDYNSLPDIIMDQTEDLKNIVQGTDQHPNLEPQKSPEICDESLPMTKQAPAQNLSELKQKSCSNPKDFNEKPRVKRGTWIVKLKRLEISQFG